MEIDKDKVDEAVLALLYLTLQTDGRAWKGMDFEAMSRLYEKGYILNPVNTAKSVLLTEEGAQKSRELFNEMFVKRAGDVEKE